MADLARRVALGFVAAVISVLIFHQGMWTILHVAEIPGMTMPPPFPTDPIPPLGVPRIVSLCFWGGVWGALFGAICRRPSWRGGILLGVAAAATGLIIVAAIKGLPIGGGWKWTNWARSLLINGTWGLGVGLILPTLTRLVTGRRDG